jgi:Condensation domain
MKMLDTPRTSDSPVGCFPLVHSQRLWFEFNDPVDIKNYTRFTTFAFQIIGKIDHNAFLLAVGELAQRQHSLRIVFPIINGIRYQKVSSTFDGIDYVDLSNAPSDSKEALARQVMQSFVDETVDVTIGPLFAIKLIKLSDFDCFFIAGIDHAICDAFSIGILLRELWDIYTLLQNGIYERLPDLAMQFTDYALTQANGQTTWDKKNGAYWEKRLAGFLEPSNFSNAQPAPAQLTSLRLESELVNSLRELARKERTSLALSVLAAFVAFTFKQHGNDDVLVRLTQSGREFSKSSSTIGPFLYPLFLRIEISEKDSYIDVLKRVKNEFIEANDHCDHGKMSLCVKRDPHLRFNWLPSNFTSISETKETRNRAVDSLRTQQIAIKASSRPPHQFGCEVGLNLIESPHEVTGDLKIASEKLSGTPINEMTERFYSFVKAVVDDPMTRLSTLKV